MELITAKKRFYSTGPRLVCWTKAQALGIFFLARLEPTWQDYILRVDSYLCLQILDKCWS